MDLLRAIANSTRLLAAKVQWAHVAIILFFVMLVLVASAISVLGYVRHIEWTGVPDRTFWHWLELLVAPVLLSGGGFLIYAAWAWSDHRLAQKHAHEAARHAALDGITKGYIDDIERLLFKTDSKEKEKVSALARARTLTVLHGLDPYRKGSIIQFLFAARLLEQPKSSEPKSSEQESSQQLVIRLKGANLREVHLRWADLHKACLRGADLSYANLRGAKLSKADLQKADLRGACLIAANLMGTDLRAADLTSALVKDTQLARAKLARGKRLVGLLTPGKRFGIESATMPNGQKYEDWLKEKESHRDKGQNSGPS